jgi:hypothetical protein
MNQGKAVVVLIFAGIFRLAFIFKPTIGDQTDTAISIAETLITKVEQKHGKINFDG